MEYGQKIDRGASSLTQGYEKNDTQTWGHGDTGIQSPRLPLAASPCCNDPRPPSVQDTPMLNAER